MDKKLECCGYLMVRKSLLIYLAVSTQYRRATDGRTEITTELICAIINVVGSAVPHALSLPVVMSLTHYSAYCDRRCRDVVGRLVVG